MCVYGETAGELELAEMQCDFWMELQFAFDELLLVSVPACCWLGTSRGLVAEPTGLRNANFLLLKNAVALWVRQAIRTQRG